jgi:hypothetical protein
MLNFHKLPIEVPTSEGTICGVELRLVVVFAMCTRAFIKRFQSWGLAISATSDCEVSNNFGKVCERVGESKVG